MNKSILWLIGLLFAASCTIVSCSETDDVEDPYANWADRNQLYIDSIAKVARANEGSQPGQWKIIRSYKLPSLGLDQTPEVNDYVYAKIIENGDPNGASALFKDSVRVSYRGKMINGVIFDATYQGEFDLATAGVVGFRANEVVVGWTSALMQKFGDMKVGDYWELYIPSDLGYGVSGKASIPGYSTLIFNLYLRGVYPLEGNERSLKAVKVEKN